ncbi:MAG: hypothetical protein QG658_496 [Patescibacteria group bacterium]|jgi:cytochrome c biogenesis protein CcdA|nr:hypothetical protein [Patescibacteria group bacterium]
MGPIELFIFALLGLLLYGIVVSFSPTLFVTEVAILTRSKRPFVHTLAFLAGIAIPLVVYIVLAITITQTNQEFQIPSTREIIGSLPLVSILAGILLIGAGLRLRASQHLAQPSPDKAEEHPEKIFHTKSLFWFGLIKMGTSLSSIAAILLGVSFIQSFVTRGAFQTMALLWFLAISLLPFVGLASLKRYAPKTFSRLQKSSDRVANYDWLKVLRWVFLASGVILIASALMSLS